MSEERVRILEMVATGRLTVDEAARLLDALAGGLGSAGNSIPSGEVPPAAQQGAEPGGSAVGAVSEGVGTAAGGAPLPKFIYVEVDSDKGDNVNVKVPLSLLRAGLKLTSLIPAYAQDEINKSLAEHGMEFDLSEFKAADVEELLEALRETEVKVDSAKGEKVRIYAA